MKFSIKDFFSGGEQISRILRNCSNLLKTFFKENFFFRSVQFTFAKITDRSSHQRCSIKKGVLRNFAKFTGKHLYQSLFFNKAAGLKKRLWHRWFPVNFAKFFRTPFTLLLIVLLGFLNYLD